MTARRVLICAIAAWQSVSLSLAPATLAADVGDPVLVGAGDIASCTTTADTATAALLDGIDGTVMTLGDNAYPDGTPAQFADCYDPTWGRHRSRTRPAAGNHDYRTTDAAGYFGYFGSAAGPTAKGYYSYDLGAWHIVVLNSTCDATGGCGSTSPQAAWLRGDLAAHAGEHVLAYWHEPLFTSGRQGPNPHVQAFWEILYAAGADVILNGHDHDYERFSPQDPWGRPDGAHGIRSFIVGTGGAELRPRATTARNSEMFVSAFGILKLTLRADSYDWAFIPIAGGSLTDAGSGTPHGAPPTRTRRKFAVTSDAWVDQAHRHANYGTSTRLRIDGDTEAGRDARAYLKVRVTGVTGPIDRAALRLWVTNPTKDGPTIAPTSAGWSGRTITWANRPAPTGPASDDLGAVPSGAWVDLDVTSQVTGDGTYAFVLRSASGDGLTASSIQGSHPPRLFVETISAP